MSETTVVNLTLEFTLQLPSEYEDRIDLIAETLMQGAVNASSKNISGIGYTYDYTHKKSRRGMTIRSQK
jgi:hypothetical protein